MTLFSSIFLIILLQFCYSNYRNVLYGQLGSYSAIRHREFFANFSSFLFFFNCSALKFTCTETKWGVQLLFPKTPFGYPHCRPPKGVVWPTVREPPIFQGETKGRRLVSTWCGGSNDPRGGRDPQIGNLLFFNAGRRKDHWCRLDRMGQTTPKRGRSPQLGNFLFFLQGKRRRDEWCPLDRMGQTTQSGVVTQS